MKYSSIPTTLFALAGAASASTVVYDFSSSSAWTSDFRTNYEGSPIAWQSDSGLNGSGSLNVQSGDGTQAWFSQSYFNTIDLNQTLELGLYFKYAGGEAVGGIKLGFATDADATANFYGMPDSGNWGYFGWFSFGPESYLPLGNEVYSSQGYMGSGGTVADPLSVDSWYYQSFSMTKVAEGTFDISYGIQNSSSTGVLGSYVLQGADSGIYRPDLDTNLYVYIGLEGADSYGQTVAIDNITMSSDSQVSNSSAPSVVPEPSAVLLGLISGLSLIRRRR
jgi:hypothetical protein